ncbi:hypothetical protein H0W91_02385 [Patescibacteria group bacterium]|nr:hypothetical protein [Patescibacteria group bacterium]
MDILRKFFWIPVIALLIGLYGCGKTDTVNESLHTTIQETDSMGRFGNSHTSVFFGHSLVVIRPSRNSKGTRGFFMKSQYQNIYPDSIIMIGGDNNPLAPLKTDWEFVPAGVTAGMGDIFQSVLTIEEAGQKVDCHLLVSNSQSSLGSIITCDK